MKMDTVNVPNCKEWRCKWWNGFARWW